MLNQKTHFNLNNCININPYDIKNYRSLYKIENHSNLLEEIQVYLKCKITKNQMEKPTRGKNCLHFDCVEFPIFINYLNIYK